MEVFIIEDDVLWRTKLEMAIKEIGLSVIGKCGDIQGSRVFLEAHSPDLIVSDIMLGEDVIFDLFADGSFVDIPVLFVTQSIDPDNYEQARVISNSHFLVKPFHPLSLRAAIDLLMKDHPKAAPAPGQGFTVRGRHNEIIVLPPCQVSWVCQDRNYCSIRTSGGEQFSIKVSLRNASRYLGPGFIKVNRGCMLNRKLPVSLDLDKKQLKAGYETFLIGRIFRKTVLQHVAAQERAVSIMVKQPFQETVPKNFVEVGKR